MSNRFPLLRASLAAAVFAAVSVAAVAPSQACEVTVFISTPTTLNDPVECVVVTSESPIAGDITNNTQIGNAGGDIAVNVIATTVTGRFINNGLIIQDGPTPSNVSFATYAGSDIAGGIVNNGTIRSTSGVGLSLGILLGFVTPSPVNQTGAIDNFGVIDGGLVGFDGIAGSFLNTLWNHEGATISGGVTGILTEATLALWQGGIVNDGSIVGSSGNGINLGQLNTVPLTFTGGISNGETGTITGGGASAVAVVNTQFSGGIANQGLMSGFFRGVILDANQFTGGIDNAASGQILGNLTGILVNGGTFAGGIDNAGRIAGAAEHGIFVDVTSFTGDIVNRAGGVVEGATGGIDIRSPNWLGNLSNAGTIHATINPAVWIRNSLLTGAVDNYGFMISDGGAVPGSGASSGFLISDSTFIGTLTNHAGALIRGSDVGVYAVDTVPGNSWNGGIVNAGTIRGGILGINIANFSFAGGIVNQATGTITADNGSALYTQGAFYAGGIDNAGLITASGNLIPNAPFISGGLGIRMLANTVLGTFQNRSTGVIDGKYIGASFQGSTFDGLFRNAGLILGGDPLETTGYGYGFGATFSYNIWNGDIINEATGSIVARTQNLIVPGFIADNAGLAVGRIVDGNYVTGFTGNIANAGTIRGPIGVEVLVNSYTGNFDNTGSITSQTNALVSNFGEARGVRFIAGTFLGDFTNGASGIIRDTSPNAPDNEVNTVGIATNVWNGTFRNAGRIENAANPTCGDCSGGLDIRSGVWTGNFINEATGVIGNADRGVDIETQTFIGNADNAGRIGDTTAEMGMILGAASFYGEVFNRAGGVIEGANLGLGVCGAQCDIESYVPGDGFVGTLRNAGRIANIAPAPDEPWAALIVYHDTWTGDIINEVGGVITSPRHAVSIAKFSPLIDEFETTAPMDLFTGNFINRGTIQGGVDLLITSLVGNFDNSGSITATGEGLAAFKLAGGLDGLLLNSGTITGDIALDLAGMTTAATYRQSGAAARTVGDILMSTAVAITLDFRGGTLSGDVLGAGLDDRFEVNAGAGGFAYLDGVLSNLAAFSVNSGTTILGSTAVGANGAGVTMTNAGALSVGAGATLYLDDNTSIAATSLSLTPTSTFAAFLTTNTAQHGSIVVSEGATLAGSFVAHIDPLAFAGSGQTEFAYNGLISGPVTGTFSSVTIFGAPNLFTITPIYNSFDLLIELQSFAELAEAESPNQVGVGEAIDEIYEQGNDDPDLVNLIETLADAPEGTIGDILDAIAGSTQAETQTTALKSDDPWKQSVGQRVNAARSTGCTVAGDTWCFKRYAQAPAPVTTDATADSDAFAWLETGLRDVGATSFWGRVVGVWGETDGGVSSPGSQQQTYGLVGGADHVFNSTLLLGVAGQYVRTKADFESSRNESLIEAVQGGAYFSYGGAELYVNGNASVIGTRSKTNRFFSVGAIDYNAAVRFPSTSLTGSLEVGKIFEVDGYRLEPNLGMNYAGQFTDPYREDGAGGLGLIVDPDDLHSLRSMVGGRVSRVFDIGDRKIVPEFRVEWRHEYLDRRHTFQAAFQGAPDTTFFVSCEPSARDTFALGTSMTVPLSGRLTGFVDAEGAFSDDARSGTLSLGARATW